MLIDAKGFDDYDNREFLIPPPPSPTTAFKGKGGRRGGGGLGSFGKAPGITKRKDMSPKEEQS